MLVFRTVRPSTLVMAVASAAIASTALSDPRVSAPSEYPGSADASAAVSIGSEFFLVADDEDDTLRVYPRHGNPAAVKSVNAAEWSQLQVPGAKKRELDIEGAAQLGDKVFWIGSHGNSSEGKVAPNRRQLFATTITRGFDIALVGEPYRTLVEDLAAAPQLREFKLNEAAAKGRAPKEEGGFNLEGLCSTPNGHLLIAFRNPIRYGRALLVPLMNPEEVIQGKPATFGDPIQLDLQGRGIRDLILVGAEYFIVAGDYRGADEPDFLVSQLYQWTGGSAKPKLLLDLPQLKNPEAIIAYPDTGKMELQVLSDDGQKPPLPPTQRTFHSVLVDF